VTTPTIAVRGVSKSFPGVLANDNVSFDVRPGEVHALLGENGAGKSTLAAILTGLYQPDSGEILLRGEAMRLRSPREGLAQGIGMVHQHFRLVPRFTVAENILLGDKRHPWMLSTGKVESAVSELSERYGLAIHPAARVSDLTVGEQQRVEIIKTLFRGAQVLLLDEPTSVLTPQEAEALFATVRTMSAEGKSVVFISHKLGEVMAVSDRVTVMRDGRVTGSVETSSTDRDELARMMVGRDVDLSPRRGTSPAGAALLELTGVSTGDPHARGRISNISLAVRAGEILGIAGVSGNGQKALAETIAGIRSPREGRVVVAGKDTTGQGPRAARDAGLAYVPEDRNGTGLAPSLSIVENMMLTERTGALIDTHAATELAERSIREYSIKTPGPQTPTRLLSGGNVQKVLIARELSTDPKILIVSSPTWGLDVGAVEFVRGQLDRLRAEGCAVLLISEDLDEVRALSDRIMVLFEGEIVYECPGEGSDVVTIGLAMAGVKE
jgi:general nucleoside transport system ATP-binding protein